MCFCRIGEIFKKRLEDESCICKATAPKAYSIVCDNEDEDGWTIFEGLLTQCLVKCGALPDVDLDKVLGSLVLMKGESFADFYNRCNKLESEYKLQYKEMRLIPSIKILDCYVNQLLRAREFLPYLLHFQDKLIDHYERFNDRDFSVTLPFTLKQVYRKLQRNGVSQIPSDLKPLPGD